MNSSRTQSFLVYVWILAGVLIFFIMFFFSNGYARQRDQFKGLSEYEREVVQESEERYLANREMSPLRFNGDAVIEKSEYIHGDVVVMKGTLLVAGEIDGNIVAIFGDVDLQETAIVSGDVVSVEGKIWRRTGASVSGDIVETDAPEDLTGGRNQRRVYRGMQGSDDDDRRTPRVVRKRMREYEEDEMEPCWMDYTRVDGLTLGLKSPEREWWQDHHHSFAILGRGGYSFASKKWQYQVGLERSLSYDYIFSFGAEYHNMTDTQDRWIISDHENALAALLIKEDFRDYYHREGYSFYAIQKLSADINIRGEYRSDAFNNLLENKASWSMFGKKKKFGINPYAIPPVGDVENDFYAPAMDIQSIAATFTIDTRDSRKNPTRGWYIQAFGERAGYELKSDMEFQRFILDIRKYQPLGWDENFNFRLRGCTATGLLPPMYWYDLGGLSTLRGYRHKSFTGDRMLLGNVEYVLHTDNTNLFILDDFNIILFVDSGCAWFADADTPNKMTRWPVEDTEQVEANEVPPEDSFETITWSSLKTNVGIGLASRDGGFRVDFAKSTERGENDYYITLRFQHPF
ncbi:BamA/TamA family outer membrane protein [candidate division KSB1 bacterium]|nr:BamA/TamA family outer membrane protein [candidate division KSB1 bacterium]